ncbi:type II secretion system F family protein [Paradesulfitobacterium aromaticivorans]
MKPLSYDWKAVDESGRLRGGVSSLSGVEEIRAWLRKQGYYPLSITPRQQILETLWLLRESKYVWVSLTRRLAVLLEAGIPLLRALHILSLEEKDKHKQDQWQTIAAKIESGSDLSEALQFLTPAPTVYLTAMVKAGERTGRLAEFLHEAAAELEQEYLFWRKVQGALAYPLLLLAGSLAVIHILSWWVLPMYEQLFAGMDAELPFLTRVIFGLGKQIPVFLWLLAGVFALVLMARRFNYSRSWKLRLEKTLALVPFFGTLYREADLVQFSRILGGLLDAGISLLDSLRLAAASVRSLEMQLLINDLSQGVHEGKSLAPFIRASRLFPVAAAEMIVVGEESGRLDYMFKQLAKILRGELETKLERLVRMLEPALISFLAFVIGMTAVGVLLPVFETTVRLN